MSLTTPHEKVQKLQRALYTKAKVEPDYRFYSLTDKIWRKDVLQEAYRHCRENKGSAGVDNETFERIESDGLEAWLGKLAEELQAGYYRPQPLKRVWIPKAHGGQRPLGIPVVRDRVAQMAATLVLMPIFEADFPRNQYGFRPKLDAKMAVRKVHHHVVRHGRTEVVDADLKDYFNSIPHSALMKSVARRIADGRMLSLIKSWLESPVIESTREGQKRSTSARDSHRGTPQGGVISPLLANIYFRRFLKAWERTELEQRGRACVVNYADDYVICCYPGYAKQALQQMQRFMEKLGLSVNQEKTRSVRLPEGAFEFLGYRFGRYYSPEGKPYIGTRPGRKALKRVLQSIHEETARNTTWDSQEYRVRRINAIIRGWAGYFNQGPVLKAYAIIERYACDRVRRWLVIKHKQRGTKGYRRYPDKYLHEALGLIQLPTQKADLSRAKV